MRRNVKFFLYKALIYVVTFFLVLIVNFILPRLAPGNIAAIILSKFLKYSCHNTLQVLKRGQISLSVNIR